MLRYVEASRMENPGMDIKKRVGLRIRAIRQQKKLTQEELAALLDRSVDAVSNLERGVSLPNFETLERMSDKLGVPVKAFFDFGLDEDITRHRAELLEHLRTTAAQLYDRELELALSQLRAILEHRNG
jgi:transcriptional regulator with XRE-family HTH domain